MTPEQLQRLIGEWHEKRYPGVEPNVILLKLMEEVGELARSVMKPIQGLQSLETAREDEEDAIGDITVVLLSYCAAREIDFWKTAEKTAEEVMKR